MRWYGNSRRPPRGSSGGGWGLACVFAVATAAVDSDPPEAAREMTTATTAKTNTRTASAAIRRCRTTRLCAASLRARRWSALSRSGGSVVRYPCCNLLRLGRRRLLLGRRLRPGPLRPLFAKADPPLAFLVLLELELGPECAARAPAETRDLALRATDRRLVAALDRLAQALDQLLDDRRSQRLAGLVLPDHEATARVLARPARVALAVLDDVAPADRARAEVGPLDLDVLQVPVKPLDNGVDELGRVVDELLARFLAVLDLVETPLPVARQLRRR